MMGFEPKLDIRAPTLVKGCCHVVSLSFKSFKVS